MPSGLPYFKWFPKDAEIDELYVSMSDEEVGFYHRLLNKAWINGGLPADLNELARLMHRTRRQLEKLWNPKVCRCWIERGGRLYNARQEIERESAMAKGKHAADAANARWNRHADAYAEQQTPHCSNDAQPDAEHMPRALARAGSGSAYESEIFQVFWSRFPRKHGRREASQAFAMVVKQGVEQEVMACLERYLASDEVSRNKVQNPERWLYQQAANAWAGEWPKAEISRQKLYRVPEISAPNREQELDAIRALLDDENETEENKILLRKRLSELDTAS